MRIPPRLHPSRKLSLLSSDRAWTPALKGWIEIVQGLLTIAAIAAGAYWFLAQQSLKPQIKLEQTFSQRPLIGHPGYWLTAIDVRATNTGKVKVELTGGKVTLAYINPTGGSPFDITDLKDLYLDPGESDQALFKTYAISDTMKTVQFTSFYGVPGTDKYQWQISSAVDIAATAPGSNHGELK